MEESAVRVTAAPSDFSADLVVFTEQFGGIPKPFHGLFHYAREFAEFLLASLSGDLVSYETAALAVRLHCVFVEKPSPLRNEWNRQGEC